MASAKDVKGASDKYTSGVSGSAQRAAAKWAEWYGRQKSFFDTLKSNAKTAKAGGTSGEQRMLDNMRAMKTLAGS